MREVVIVSACRTAIGKFQGQFKDVTARELAVHAGKEAIARAGVEGIFKITDNALALPFNISDSFILVYIFLNDTAGITLRIIVTNDDFIVFAELRND